jgi:hypothetical protein
MNTVSTMKLVSAFSRLALTSVAAFALGVAFDVQPLALFSLAAAALTLLVVASDYAPRHRARAVATDNVISFNPAPARVDTIEKLAA